MNTDFAKLAIASLFALTALAGSGCAAIEHNAQEGDTMLEGDDAIRSRATWFRVRASVPTSFPFSYQAKAADTGNIACPSGGSAPQCGVDSINWSALRLSADDAAEILVLANQGNLLIRGSMKRVSGQTVLTAADIYEDVLGEVGISYFDKTCEHVAVKPSTRGPSHYGRLGRLMGAPYNDTAEFYARVETNPNIVMDARDLVVADLGKAAGLLLCTDSASSYPRARAVLLNIKDTYAP